MTDYKHREDNAPLQMAEQPDTMIVADPSLLEEECCKGKMVIGVNAYREVCSQQSRISDMLTMVGDAQHHENESSCLALKQVAVN